MTEAIGPLLEQLSDSWVAEALKSHPRLYILANAAHILSIGLLIGAILPLDLRILGLFRRSPLSVLAPFLSRAAMTGVVLSVLTGAVIFTVDAGEYAENPAFLTKLAIVAAGLVNAAALHALPAWRHVREDGEAPPSAKAAAFLSILIWPGAILAGRWIGFV